MVAQLSRSSARGWARQAFASITQLPDSILLTVDGWRERFLLQRELDNLRQQGELDRTLIDSGIAPSDVPRLMRAHPHTPQQLSEMMRRLGIDRAALPRSAAVAEAVRAMEWRCGECTDWRKCRAWLAGLGGPASYRAFCPNAEVLDTLRCAETTASGSSFGKPCGILPELEAAKAPD
jgi:hypothetical protein